MNKEVCKRCINRNGSFWDEIDEEEWKEGKIYCIYIGRHEEWDMPPKSCPYALEHFTQTESGF